MTSTRQSSNTCSTCRARKVRCDGRRDICSNCERLGFACAFDQPGTREPRRSVPRKRAHAACLACHASRARCNEERPRCQRCLKTGQDCTYSGDQPSSIEDVPSEPSQSLVAAAFQHFFSKLSQIPVFSFLHQACVREQHRNGVLDRSLLLAIVGLASLLGGLDDKGDALIDEATSIVINDLERPTVPRVQALILIIKYRALTRRFASMFMLSAIAMRFATGLRLNYEDHHMGFLARESCRRTMWSFYMIDAALSAGYQDFSLSTSEMIHIKLPCHDKNFNLDQAPGEEDADSPLALVLRMAQLRQRVLQFTKKIVKEPQASEATSGIRSFQLELEEFTDGLPNAFQFSKHNLMLHAYASTMSTFVTLHAVWHGCQCILHRLVLTDLDEALPESTISELDPEFRRQCELSCFQHPTTAIAMLQAIQEAGLDSVPLDLDVAVCIYQCLRVMIRSYQSRECTAQELSDRCKAGLRFLQESFPVTPATDAIIKDTESLLGQSAEPSSRQPVSHHVLSKHSLVGQIDLPSKKDSFVLSPATDQMKTQAPQENDWGLEDIDLSLYSFADLPEDSPRSLVFPPSSWIDGINW